MIIISICIAVVLLGGVGVLLWLGRREHCQTAHQLAEISALTKEHAEKRARLLLTNPEMFQVKHANPSEIPAELPPAVRKLLGEYDEVVRDEFWLGRAALAQPSKLPEHIKIGEDFEFTEMFSRTEGLEIYTVYRESQPDEPPDVHQTVWHKLLEVSAAKP